MRVDDGDGVGGDVGAGGAVVREERDDDGHATGEGEGRGERCRAAPHDPARDLTACRWWPSRRGGRLERRVLPEDRIVQLPQRLAWLHGQLVDEQPARLPVELERLGLAPAAVQREHALGSQALPHRVRGAQRLELADQRRVPAQRQVGLDARLERLQVQLFQPRDLAGGERVEREVRKRRAAPQRERLAQTGGGFVVLAIGEGTAPVLK